MEAYIFTNTIDIDYLTDNEQLERIDLKNIHLLMDEHGNEIFISTDDDGYMQSLFAHDFRTAAFILNKLLNEYGVKVIDIETVKTNPIQFQQNSSFEDFLKLSAISHSDSDLLADHLRNIEWGEYYNNYNLKR
jgi:hypothetical protein